MEKNERSMKKGKKAGFIILSIAAAICMILYLAWRVLFTLPNWKEFGWVAFIAGVCLVIAEGLSVLEALIHYIDLNRQYMPPMPVIPNDWYPDVDVMIATHNEEEELLFKTANACVRMKYPDPQKVHIFLCDDTNRKGVKELADKLHIGYLGMEKNKEAKAGNLNNAISKTSSPLIVTFDADMIPNSEFLMETVPYFFLPKMKQDEDGKWIEKTEDEIDEKEKIGFIQTPQSFYNADLFQYNLFSEGRIPNEQDYFFRQVNTGKNRSNSPIYAGSNTVISREALAEVGGIRTGTITEDFETGLLIESKGYKCYAVDKLLAKGLAPITIPSLIKQRERWARGCIYSLRRVHLILNPKINFKLKMGYLACRIYWGSFTRRFLYIISPILFMLLGIPVVVCDFKELILIWLPSYILYGITLKKISGDIRNTRWSNIIDTTIFPYLLIPVWAEALFIRKREFNVTNKAKSMQEEKNFYMALPHIVLLVLSVIAIIFAVKDLVLYRAFGTIVVIYWLLINSFSLIMAIFFMKGRKNERMTERFLAELPIEAQYQGKTYQGMAEDISEGGFSFVMDDAVYLPHEKGQDIDFFLQYGEYYAKVIGHIVTVKRLSRQHQWKYCVFIVEMDEDNLKEYMQIVYDRVHTLPKLMSRSSSYFGDIALNLSRRTKQPEKSHRRTARIVVNEDCILADGTKVRLENFNFEFVRLSCADGMKLPDKLTLYPESEYEIHCEKSNVNPNVYAIINWEELKDNQAFSAIIRKWEKNEKVNTKKIS